MSRSKAEELLQSVALGGFLVRRSETNPSAYSLSIRHHQGYLHMIISRVAPTQRACSSSTASTSSSMPACHASSTLFILGQHSQPFPSVPVMMRHYQHHILPIRGADAITLGEPVLSRLQIVNRNREQCPVMVSQSRRRRE
jgi:SH2 domain-containing adapter protein B/D/E/F